MRKIYAKYLSDPETAARCSDENFIRAMLDAEIALAWTQAQLGMIPQAAADEIASSLTDFDPTPELLADGTLQNGIPTIPLLALARRKLSAEARDFLHWGATSQDIMDTAQVMIIREVAHIFYDRVTIIVDQLEAFAHQHADTQTVARTRNQQAVPILFSQKVLSWRKPLLTHLIRLEELKPRLFIPQLGGAGGNRAALGEQGEACARLFAEYLHLYHGDPWHSQRDRIVEFSNWLALVTGSLAKMAQDILLLSQSEVGELIENAEGGGGSSTMPHKNNPVLSEAIVALAHYVGQLAGANFQALIHRHERDGTSWLLEWLSLPEMMTATGAAMNHALTISANLQLNEKAVQANLEKSRGLIYSEKASIILADHFSRSEAKEIVGRACDLVLQQDIHLADALSQLLPELAINWHEQLQ